ncbi:hypothetical protein [Effusibacillus consociatus]|uniref:Uncharacterized protein n=1 Tax=Effusibacillus consociatus TaxID=1117041 RepID=A0ABV9PXQ2_9BACL
MEIAKAIQIIEQLSDGVDPVTGEVFPMESPYQHAETVRALTLACKGLEALNERSRRKARLPQNAGKAWSSSEDEDVINQFRSGLPIKEIAERHMRTEGAILSRLVKLGEIKEE